MTLFTATFYESSYRPSYDTCFCAQVSGLLNNHRRPPIEQSIRETASGAATRAPNLLTHIPQGAIHAHSRLLDDYW